MKNISKINLNFFNFLNFKTIYNKRENNNLIKIYTNMKNLFNYFVIAAFVSIFVGMIYAANDSGANYEKMKEQKRIEKILEQRREKVDSLRLEKIMLVIGNEDGTTR